MLNLKKKLQPLEQPKSVTDQFPVPYPQVTSILPDNPPVVGHEFNLVRIVEDHGPKRISAIEKEITKLQDKIATLTKEKNQIAAFVATLGAP